MLLGPKIWFRDTNSTQHLGDLVLGSAASRAVQMISSAVWSNVILGTEAEAGRSVAFASLLPPLAAPLMIELVSEPQTCLNYSRPHSRRQQQQSVRPSCSLQRPLCMCHLHGIGSQRQWSESAETCRAGVQSGNKFTGTLPSAFSPTSLMHSFDAADNALTGTIPSLWWTPPHIQYMGLAANQLSGTLPGPSTGTPASFSARRDVHGACSPFLVAEEDRHEQASKMFIESLNIRLKPSQINEFCTLILNTLLFLIDVGKITLSDFKLPLI